MSLSRTAVALLSLTFAFALINPIPARAQSGAILQGTIAYNLSHVETVAYQWAS